ncbi:FecCD family ABC transporter permease [Vagococcus xieshaowenii]|uniref:Iron ABC transporter permease n=1 Tax=Vagococcus xieshaowenii TaxID=2562451 RepID=A0AAJ5EE49_9ENTE|nr:iron ABC transporter permease [Vagococcus xieshaowenii]QCA28143.1 iron ABC transporter permease [Vagococcus xieshaowenii]TFZ39731.1 iron ABC transporter permease [Vagococcus xieshaowenii]
MSKGMKLSGLMVIAIVVIVIGISIGSASASFADVCQVIMNQLMGRSEAGIMPTIILDVRLPRVLMSFIVGAMIAVSGTVMQSLLNNPLASPYTLGISSGASFGAALMLTIGVPLLGLSSYLVPVNGFVFGCLTVLIVLLFAKKTAHQMDNQTIILVGMIVGLFINALLTLLSVFSDDYLKAIVYWQLGSFASSHYAQILWLALLLVLGLVVFIRFSRELDILTLGDEQAMTTGLETQKLKVFFIGLCCLLTGSAISFVGIIGFVDLVAPHLVRKVFGHHHRWVIPSSALVGGILMVFADLISRTIIAPREIPVGAVTALIGSPFFAYLFLKKGPD